MLDNAAWPRVQGIVNEHDFYRHEHKIIFRALSVLLNDGKPADVLTVSDYLDSKGMLEKVGGLGGLGGFAKDTPSAANISSYAAIVQEKSMLRHLVTVAGEISELAFSGDREAKEIVADAESKIFEVAQRGLRGKKGFARLREILSRVCDIMDENMDKSQKGVLGLSTGFKDVDRLTSGMSPGDLIIVAGRPSMGKTTFSMNIAEHVALRENKLVAVFSMEMQDDQLGMRVLSNQSNVGLSSIRQSWNIQDCEWPMIVHAVSRMGDSPLFVDDTPALTISDVRSRTMRLAHESNDEFPDGVGLVVVDYIQLMRADQARNENRTVQIEEITRGLKRLAKELGIPVIALSQLNRSLESRPNKRPIMSDLRESGSIEQDADGIVFLYRDEVYNKDTPEPGIAEAIFAKQRQGPIGTVKLVFEGANTRFRDLSDYDYAGY